MWVGSKAGRVPTKADGSRYLHTAREADQTDSNWRMIPRKKPILPSLVAWFAFVQSSGLNLWLDRLRRSYWEERPPREPEDNERDGRDRK